MLYMDMLLELYDMTWAAGSAGSIPPRIAKLNDRRRPPVVEL
jgi:hypothetical protein